jgi:hypothetical protein
VQTVAPADGQVTPLANPTMPDQQPVAPELTGGAATDPLATPPAQPPAATDAPAATLPGEQRSAGVRCTTCCCAGM